jgi:hypothetical protein
MSVQDVIRDADKAAHTFSDIPPNERLKVISGLSLCASNGIDVDEALERVDPDCELSEAAEDLIKLHAEEPLDAILGIILHLILQSTDARQQLGNNFVQAIAGTVLEASRVSTPTEPAFSSHSGAKASNHDASSVRPVTAAGAT